MAYKGFSKLQSDDVEDARPHVTCRPYRPFTPFELGLITTLVLFATALATYTVVYIVQHHGALKPAAVAALSCMALLLLAIAYSVHQRIRRPNWFRDVESGGINKQAISAPILMSESNLSEVTIGSKGTYTSIPSARLHKSPGTNNSNDSKKGGHRFLFWGSKKTTEDGEHLFSSCGSSERSSAELNETYRISHDNNNIRARPLSLWRSVFELPGESDTSRPATPELPAEEPVQIVVTRPEPTARHNPQPLRRGRSQSTSSLATIDPLRSNPFHLHQIQRDPSSVRQTKSSHALVIQASSASPGLEMTVTPPRRPRSAEPGPDRARLGQELDLDLAAGMGLGLNGGSRAGRLQVQAYRPQARQSGSQGQQNQAAASAGRGLRRARSPAMPDIAGDRGTGRGQDLRSAYQGGL